MPSRSGTKGPFDAPDERPVESLALAEPTFNEKAVADILQRAAALDRKERAVGSSLTQAEIEQIARDAGIDPRLVRQAISERENQEPQTLGRKLAGAPLRRTVERVVDRELSADLHEVLAADIRAALSPYATTLPLQVSSVGRSLTVTGFAGRSIVEVTVSPEGKKTRIRVSTNASNLAGGLYGGLIGGIGGGFGINAGLMTGTLLAKYQEVPVPLAVLVGAAAFFTVAGGAYSLARTIFVHSVRPVHARAEKLAQTIAARLEQPRDPVP